MDELGAVSRRFVTVAVRWALDGAAAARLLGAAGDWAGRPLYSVVENLTPDGEMRMRLLCDVDALLWRIVPDHEVADWLRSPDVGYEDRLVSPMEALSTGAAAVRALRRHLECRDPSCFPGSRS